MAVIDVYNIEKEKISQIELSDRVFDVPVKAPVLHQVVVSQLLGKRTGTAKAKTRAEVDMSGKKLYRQKGTGRARAGAASSPTRKGGGVAFGPKPRKYIRKVPKNLRKLALRMALTEKYKNNQLIVLDQFNLQEIKTKNFVQVMHHFDVRKALIITEAKNENLEKSSQNVPWVKVMRYVGINAYDVLNYEHLFLIQSTVNKIEEALIS
jgi:large subunit ribosomal protein L4